MQSNDIDITNNIEYRYKNTEFREDDKEHTFSETDKIKCNCFFENLNIFKSIEGEDIQAPIWNFTIPDPEGEEPFTIKLEHKEVYSPKNVQRAFQSVGFTGFPKVFVKKGKGFLWEYFMDYVSGKFRKASVIEQTAIDIEAETLLTAICKLFIRDTDSWYSGKAGLCAALENKEGKECLAVKGTDIAEILKGNKITRDPAQIGKKLNEKGLKLRKTYQPRTGGVRCWYFPIEGLLPFGFSVDRAKKIETISETVDNIDDLFTPSEAPIRADVLDWNTGSKREA